MKNPTAPIVTLAMLLLKASAAAMLPFAEGKIAGDGSHEELLAGCGIYKKMWEAQACNYQ